MSLHNFGHIERVLKDGGVDKTESTSAGVRVLLWKSALELAAENPILGVGTGDIKDELLKNYKKNDYEYPYYKRYNAHSQYFQSLAALGTIGLILLVLIFTVSIYYSVIKRNYLFLMFILNIGVACATESILEVQAGVVFLAFFMSLLNFNNGDKHE